MSNKPSLTKKRILREALKLIDERGLSQFSIKRLADELSVFPTAITWHVGTKDELLTDVSALIFDDVTLPNDREMDWTEWLKDTARVVRAQMHRHPNIVPVAGSRLSPVIPSLPFVERVLRVLIDAQVKKSELLHAYNMYVGCLLGWVSVELSTTLSTPEKARANFEVALDGIDGNLYTAVIANRSLISDQAFMMRWSGGVDRPMDESFEFMIDTIIQGLRHRTSEQ